MCVRGRNGEREGKTERKGERCREMKVARTRAALLASDGDLFLDPPSVDSCAIECTKKRTQVPQGAISLPVALF